MLVASCLGSGAMAWFFLRAPSHPFEALVTLAMIVSTVLWGVVTYAFTAEPRGFDFDDRSMQHEHR